MSALSYVNRFPELRALPPLKQMDLLERAQRRVWQYKARLAVQIVLCLGVALAIGIAPGAYFDPMFPLEGLLVGVSVIAAMAVNQLLYTRLLHRCLRDLLSSDS